MSKFLDELQTGITTNLNIQVNVESYVLRRRNNRFELRDTGISNSLNDCIASKSNGDICLRKSNSSQTEILSFDSLLASIAIQGIKCCDFTLCPEANTEYIIFCELTRALASSVQPFSICQGNNESKYNKAYQQLEESIKWCEEQGVSFDSYPIKKAIFGWRELKPTKENKAIKNMKRFTSQEKEGRKRIPNVTRQMVLGFKFQMVRYSTIVDLDS